MGTTLTGTTPQDTYDSLIKVTDNGPLSGTAKYLSDGLGNDSALALSTSAVGINTNSPQDQLDIRNTSGTASIRLLSGGGGSKTYQLTSQLIGVSNEGFGIRNQTDSRYELVISGLGNVGIGTSAPETKLNLVGGNIRLNTGSGTVGTSSSIEFSASTNNSVVSAEIKSTRTSGAGADLKFFTTTSVGVSPTEKLSILDGGGITFNGDTAQANALDDYEEGTWTMGVSFGGASVGVTYSQNTGTYTKIGRQVTVNGYVVFTNKGSSTGSAFITGLPFALGSAGSNYSAASLYLENISFANQFMGFGVISATTCALYEITEAGVYTPLNDTDFANNSSIIVSLTYFV